MPALGAEDSYLLLLEVYEQKMSYQIGNTKIR